MSNDIQIGAPIPPVQAIAQDRGSTADVASTTASPNVPSGIMHPNPSMHLDPSLNIVIIDFYDSSGRLTSSLPTAQALAQFRMNMGPDAQPTARGAATAAPADPATDQAAAPHQAALPTAAPAATPSPAPPTQPGTSAGAHLVA